MIQKTENRHDIDHGPEDAHGTMDVVAEDRAVGATLHVAPSDRRQRDAIVKRALDHGECTLLQRMSRQVGEMFDRIGTDGSRI